MSDQERINALESRISGDAAKIMELEAKSKTDDVTIADLKAKLADVPAATPVVADAALDLSGVEKAVDAMDAALGTDPAVLPQT